MAVITLSRQLGSGGDTIAAGIAKTLGLRFVDREIIHRAALEAGVPNIALQELEYEGQKSLMGRILDRMKSMPPIPATPETYLREAATSLPPPFGGILTPPFATAMEDYVHMVEMVIRNLAKEDVVIVGRGGQTILKDLKDAFHVLVVAPLELRVKSIMAREGLDERRAQERARASDQARREYLGRYHHVNWLDATLYDLVLNTKNISTSKATELVVAACKRDGSQES